MKSCFSRFTLWFFGKRFDNNLTKVMGAITNIQVNNNQTDNRKIYNKESRIKDIELCVKFDNYFANLASTLNFAVEASNAENTNLGVIIEKITKDLRYLQENYTVVERDEKDQCVMNVF